MKILLILLRILLCIFSNEINHLHTISGYSFCGKKLFQRLDFEWGFFPAMFEDQSSSVRNRRVYVSELHLLILTAHWRRSLFEHSPVPAEERIASNLYFLTVSFTYKKHSWLHVSQLWLAFSTLQCSYEMKRSFFNSSYLIHICKKVNERLKCRMHSLESN